MPISESSHYIKVNFKNLSTVNRNHLNLFIISVLIVGIWA